MLQRIEEKKSNTVLRLFIDLTRGEGGGRAGARERENLGKKKGNTFHS